MFRIQLKKLREEAGESQYSFAKKFGVAQSTIGNWESGTREPNLDSISRLADFFGVTVDYLLGRPSAPPIQREETPPLLASLIASFKELNAEGQERLVEQADDMVQSGKYKKTASPKVGKAANE